MGVIAGLVCILLCTLYIIQPTRFFKKMSVIKGCSFAYTVRLTGLGAFSKGGKGAHCHHCGHVSFHKRDLDLGRTGPTRLHPS
ncbi:hypothetical protein PF005_g7762 [Phytophthora fragariae]|uniref:Uncharacterized protein n=1 Tax=Phytophthora fragariae TaxID=53985 RepID=A0A6A3ZRY0_9STRA|nr:hypothetical protein PF003_g23863 [Phytophthora fragariae]KAE8940551.1 hypothetical protein PF009_g9640 [Phytophthora fragariae]KAE9118638.1 hypothetical protein PF007_g8857 [Phytophthora fragariae]KAE9147352.1 hypothetical protein PF006_g7954 [Phytophthora fragariae]KAE9219713.1 hypothetical protein PF005_g7762 [Phytophthora fragariae]